MSTEQENRTFPRSDMWEHIPERTKAALHDIIKTEVRYVDFAASRNDISDDYYDEMRAGLQVAFYCVLSAHRVGWEQKRAIRSFLWARVRGQQQATSDTGQDEPEDCADAHWWPTMKDIGRTFGYNDSEEGRHQ